MMTTLTPTSTTSSKTLVRRSSHHRCGGGALTVMRVLAILFTISTTLCGKQALATTLGTKCQHDMDCTDFIKGSTCSASGYCECAPYYVQYNATSCLSSQLLGGDCLLDEQCTMKVSNSSCLDSACRCVEGFLQYRKHTCLGPAHPGAVCYSHSHCQMFSRSTHCDFLIPNLFGRCQCTAPARLVGGLCVNNELDATTEQLATTTTTKATTTTTTTTTTSTIAPIIAVATEESAEEETANSIEEQEIFADSSKYGEPAQTPGVPNVIVPEIVVPEIPEYTVPLVSVPEISVPEYVAPEVTVPQYDVPEISIPDVSIPEVAIPEVAIPEVASPHVSFSEDSLPEMSEQQVAVTENDVQQNIVSDVLVSEVKVPELASSEIVESENTLPAISESVASEVAAPVPDPVPEMTTVEDSKPEEPAVDSEESEILESTTPPQMLTTVEVAVTEDILTAMDEMVTHVPAVADDYPYKIEDDYAEEQEHATEQQQVVAQEEAAVDHDADYEHEMAQNGLDKASEGDTMKFDYEEAHEESEHNEEGELEGELSESTTHHAEEEQVAADMSDLVFETTEKNDEKTDEHIEEVTNEKSEEHIDEITEEKSEEHIEQISAEKSEEHIEQITEEKNELLDEKTSAETDMEPNEVTNEIANEVINEEANDEENVVNNGEISEDRVEMTTVQAEETTDEKNSENIEENIELDSNNSNNDAVNNINHTDNTDILNEIESVANVQDESNSEVPEAVATDVIPEHSNHQLSENNIDSNDNDDVTDKKTDEDNDDDDEAVEGEEPLNNLNNNEDNHLNQLADEYLETDAQHVEQQDVEQITDTPLVEAETSATELDEAINAGEATEQSEQPAAIEPQLEDEQNEEIVTEIPQMTFANNEDVVDNQEITTFQTNNGEVEAAGMEDDLVEQAETDIKQQEEEEKEEHVTVMEEEEDANNDTEASESMDVAVEQISIDDPATEAVEHVESVEEHVIETDSVEQTTEAADAETEHDSKTEADKLETPVVEINSESNMHEHHTEKLHDDEVEEDVTEIIDDLPEVVVEESQNINENTDISEIAQHQDDNMVLNSDIVHSEVLTDADNTQLLAETVTDDEPMELQEEVNSVETEIKTQNANEELPVIPAETMPAEEVLNLSEQSLEIVDAPTDVEEIATTQLPELDYSNMDSFEKDAATENIQTTAETTHIDEEPIEQLNNNDEFEVSPSYMVSSDDNTYANDNMHPEFAESESIVDILNDLMSSEGASTHRTESNENVMGGDLEADETYISESNAKPEEDLVAEYTHVSEEEAVPEEADDTTEMHAEDKLITFYPDMQNLYNPEQETVAFETEEGSAQNQPKKDEEEHYTTTETAAEEPERTLSPEELPFDMSMDIFQPQELESENLILETTTISAANVVAEAANVVADAETVVNDHDEEESSGDDAATASPNDIVEITTQTMLGLASRVTLMEPAAPVATTLRPLMAVDQYEATPEPSKEVSMLESLLTTKPTTEIRKRVELGLEAVSLGLSCLNDKQCQLADPHTVCNERGLCDCAASNGGQCNARSTGCSPGTFQCRASGVCISWFFVCDGRSDCNDASDEECTFNARLNQTCPTEAFRCERSGRCISRAALCDGRKQCPHGEDELGCSSLKTGECPPHTFRCKSGECLPEYEYCNAIISCRDGSDEPPHLCGSRSVPNFFLRLLESGGLMGRDVDASAYCPHKCSNGRCRSTAIVCSGRDGCGDGTDEQTCSVCRCPAPTVSTIAAYLARHRPMPLW